MHAGISKAILLSSRKSIVINLIKINAKPTTTRKLSTCCIKKIKINRNITTSVCLNFSMLVVQRKKKT